jgi:DNA-binding NarL/FixJ family response regulator
MGTHSFETSGFESFNTSRRSESSSTLAPADDFVSKGWSCESERKPALPLSPRERQILTLIIDGKTRKEVAYELNIAHSTVRVIYSRAMKKLGGRWHLSARKS